jgi:hypothetical protein
MRQRRLYAFESHVEEIQHVTISAAFSGVYRSGHSEYEICWHYRESIYVLGFGAAVCGSFVAAHVLVEELNL